MLDVLSKIFIEPLQYEFMQRAVIESVLIGITCGLVGAFIMLRRMSLIGDALAHAVLPGVIIGFMIAGKGQVAMFIGAVTAGISTSLMIGFINRNSRIKEDTSIGVMFTGAFALGVLLVSQLKNVHIDLTSYLFGDILGVSNDDLILSGIIAVVVILSVLLFYKQLVVTSFDPTMAAVMGISTGVVHYFLMSLLSMTIVASLQSVGLILVVAMLITPSATAYLLTDRLPKMLMLAVFFAVFTALVGLLGSYHFNFASGASMVVFATAVFLITLILSPSHGVLVKYIRRRRVAEKHLAQDILKMIYKKCYDKNKIKSLRDAVSIEELSTWIGSPSKRILNLADKLSRENLVTVDNGNICLTASGEKYSLRIIRSHRLWESYLINEKILTENNIHSDAEEFEHILTEDLLDEIDQKLGYPKYDPHGSPIPQKNGDV